MMVSAMAASTAKVSPQRQSSSRKPNSTPAMTATMTRRCQPRIRGFADRCARLPRCWPMPSGFGCSRVSPTVTTTGSQDRRGRGSTSVTPLSAGPSSPKPSPGSSRSAASSPRPQLSQNGRSPGSVSSDSAALGCASTGTGAEAGAGTGAGAGAGTGATVACALGQRSGDGHDGLPSWSGVTACSRAPSGAPPPPLLDVSTGTGDLRFLGFGHAIGSHLLPERNCVRTQRTAPYYHDCARSGPFKAGHSPRYHAERPGA